MEPPLDPRQIVSLIVIIITKFIIIIIITALKAKQFHHQPTVLDRGLSIVTFCIGPSWSANRGRLSYANQSRWKNRPAGQTPAEATIATSSVWSAVTASPDELPPGPRGFG